MSAQQVVSIAEQQLGISGRPNKFTQWYGSIGGTTSYACVWYLSAGVSLRQGLAFFRERQAWYASWIMQKKMDISSQRQLHAKGRGHYDPAVRRRQPRGDRDRAGNNCFYTIEGNCSNSVKRLHGIMTGS